ncbi:MAG: type II secretion system protein [Planctomycetes bacterium]|nr:type II secretion system protein [Planctomycetota bacterium]
MKRLSTSYIHRRKPAFTLLELLVVIAIIAVVLAIMLPGLAGARRSGMAAACSSRLRELGRAFLMYANDHDDHAMPLAYSDFEIIGTGPPVYWGGRMRSAWWITSADSPGPICKQFRPQAACMSAPSSPGEATARKGPHSP